MIKRLLISVILFLMVLCLPSCVTPKEPVVVKSFSMDTLDGILTKENVDIDKGVSFDGNGSLRIKADKPIKLTLFEIKDLDVDNVNLIYRANIRTQDLKGDVYLEMWCTVNGKGPYFSRSLVAPSRGEGDWQQEETPFLLEKGQKPELIKLNLSIEGTGIVWIDTVELIKVPI